MNEQNANKKAPGLSNPKMPLYEPHSGTVKVAGGTPHDGLAKSIVRLYELYLTGQSDFDRIDVTFFGMAAGYQAFRGLNDASALIFQKFGKSVAFVPAMMKTRAVENKQVTEQIKDVSVWSMVELS